MSVPFFVRPFFNWVIWLFALELQEFPTHFGINPLSRVWFVNIVSYSAGAASFRFPAEASSFTVIPCVDLCLLPGLLLSHPRNHGQDQRPEVSSCVLSGDFVVPGLPFQSLTHFKLTFVHSVR